MLSAPTVVGGAEHQNLPEALRTCPGADAAHFLLGPGGAGLEEQTGVLEQRQRQEPNNAVGQVAVGPRLLPVAAPVHLRPAALLRLDDDGVDEDILEPLGREGDRCGAVVSPVT